MCICLSGLVPVESFVHLLNHSFIRYSFIIPQASTMCQAPHETTGTL